jgi:hypothetical protein
MNNLLKEFSISRYSIVLFFWLLPVLTGCRTQESKLSFNMDKLSVQTLLAGNLNRSVVCQE